ncbi:MAG: TIGR01777 family oxidoreductase [Acidobacteriota bacterium]
MRIAVTGATGLIGHALYQQLFGHEHQFILLARNPEEAQSRFSGARIVQWEAAAGPPPKEPLEGVEVVVHLAGESIAAGRWTEARKRAIRTSRIEGTRNLVKGLSCLASPPRVLVSGSAVGYYGDRGNELLDESSRPGSGFLADVCRQWEREALEATRLGIRVVLLRTGIVLSARGGALAQMLPPFKMFLGGSLGSGRQWMSWIHLEDEVELILTAIRNESVEGPLNATSPHPRTNKEFSKSLGKVLRRPAFMPVPGFALRMLMGEMAQCLLLEGQRVLPKKAGQIGFQFKHPRLESALRNLIE